MHTPNHTPYADVPNRMVISGFKVFCLLLLFAVTQPARGGIVITEFLASNQSGLLDEDGDTSDWIELYNDGAGPVNLGGWSLTDSVDTPAKWTFPAMAIEPKGFVLVFASGKDRAAEDAPLHANFKLSADGGYLGLFQPGGVLAHGYDPYPAQYTDKPYGVQQTVASTTLVGSGASLKYLVPASGTPTTATWTARTYDDAAWTTGSNGVGFESTVPGWQFKFVQASVGVGGLGSAEAILATPSQQSNTETSTQPVVNFLNSYSDGHYGSNINPGLLGTADRDNYVVEATGLITVPSSGVWSFGINSDDGGRIQIGPVGGTLSDVVYDDSFHGALDTFGTYTFPSAGTYQIRIVVFEGGGGSGGEIFARAGYYTVWSGDFRLVGDTANGGLAIQSLPMGAAAGSGYTPFIGSNVKTLMHDATPQKSSCYARYGFTNPGGLTSLTLRLRYDDGFVAFLNGTEVGRRNAPAGTLANTSTATTNRPPPLARQQETLDLTPYLGSLVAGSGNKLAIHGLNEAANSGDFLVQAELAQHTVTTGTVSYYQTATPGAFNTAATYDRVAPVVASVPRGFFTTPQTVTLSTGTPGATIRYTFDGSVPSLAGATSATYSGPLTIARTTTLRCAAFKTGSDPSGVDTQTYLFPDDVIAQSPAGAAPAITNPAGAAQATTTWPTGPVNGQILDYGMDPEVVNNPAYSGTLVNDLKALPSISLVTDLPNLFDAGTGIYVNPGGDQIEWERPCSLEVINPDGSQGTQVNCGVRLRGGFSRSTDNPKHAFRFFFRDSYGAGKLDFPLCGTAPGTVQEFDKVDLRCAQNYSWSFGGDGGNGIFIRDKVARDMQLAMGSPGSHSVAYHLYINGQYWGIYDTDERPDAQFGAAYLGGNSDDYDALKVDPDIGYNIEATDGNTDAWQALWELADAGLAAGNSDTANNAAYQRLLGNNPDGTRNPSYPVLLDPVNTIDALLVVYYGGNLDAQISAFLSNQSPNNSFFLRDRTGEHGGFRSVLHDSEHTLLNVYENRLGPWPAGSSTAWGGGGFPKSTPQYVFQQCLYAQEFKALVADRIYRHCYNGGVLTPAAATAIFDARKAEIDRAVVAESARWGDSKSATPLTRDDNWLPAINAVRGNFFPSRTAVLISQFREPGWYPAFDPPVLSQRGGLVAPGTGISVTAGAGTPGGAILYYTADGSDPRLFGGAVNPAAQTVASGGTIAITSSKVVRARTLSGTVWSALEDVTFYVTQDYSGLALTEINYNPPGSGPASDDYEFIELKNTGTQSLDLGGLAFTEGVAFTFLPGTGLPPGGFFVIARKSATFESRYGFLPDGVFSGGLNNGGEKLTLSHTAGGTLGSVTYDDTAPWPAAADGSGFSIVPRGAAYNSGDGRDWRASAAASGSPGADDPAVSIPAIVINEILANSPVPLLDTIELRNPTAGAADIGDWWLTDDPTTPKKYRIPAGTTLSSGGFTFFDETHFNATPGVEPNFALSSAGDAVYLFSGDAAGNLTGYSHGFSFKGSEPGVSFGRHLNSVGEEQFPRQAARSFGEPNTGPLVGPLVLGEVMYHPYPGFDEYVEVRNLGADAVPLDDPANPANTWRLGGLGFTFPAASSIPAGGAALVVGIDPATFRIRYGVPEQVQLFGPYAGALQDSGERLSLEMPGTPVVVDGQPVVPYIVIDTVRYNDKLPWPVAADGGGPSLQRLAAGGYADDPTNWFANGATPGLPNSQNLPPSVTITAPANNANYTLPATVTFQAAASDPDGTVVKVEYYVNGSKVGEAASAPFTFDWAAVGGIHTVTAKVLDNGFGLGASAPLTLYVTTPVSQGLRADYFANATLSAPLAFTRTDATVNFDDYSDLWVNYGGIGGNWFSIRWTGQVRAPATGTYTFYAAADDGVRLWVNGQQLVNAWWPQGETEYGGTINLTAGQLYSVTMEMFENEGGAAARLRWSGPGIDKEIIPQTYLYPDGAPIIITHPNNETREEGASVTFGVAASGIGNTFQWRKDGAAIPGATSASFTLTPVWASDAAQYSVAVSNTDGFDISNPAMFTVTFTDSDGDGMQNAWETANGFSNGNPADALLDADGDGQNNRAEFLAGTDPRNPSSLLAIDFEALSADSYRLRFTAQPNKSYSIQYSDGLAPSFWRTLPAGQVDAQRGGAPRAIEVYDPPADPPRRFYRAIIPQQP